MEAAERYYESVGRTWERAAHIKARPCAGDIDAGAAYVFLRNAGDASGWGQVAKLTAGDGTASDRFGLAVAVQGDLAYVPELDRFQIYELTNLWQPSMQGELQLPAMVVDITVDGPDFIRELLGIHEDERGLELGPHLGPSEVPADERLVATGVRERVERAQQLLSEIGLESERLEMYNLSSAEGTRFAEIVTEMSERLNTLGPSPLRPETLTAPSPSASKPSSRAVSRDSTTFS